MDKFDFQIRRIKDTDKSLIAAFMTENWGSALVVAKGKIHNTLELPGFVYKQEGVIIGLVTYHFEKNECEIVTLDSKIPHAGLGTLLINKIIETAKESSCKRVWLITTNDNFCAIRFYQKRGFAWVGFYRDAVAESRKLKPQIPQTGFDGIPIKHELEFEYILG